MKICSFNDNRLGIVTGETVHDATEWFSKLIGPTGDAPGDPLIRALPSILAAAPPPLDGPGLPIAGLRLLSPVRRPTKIIAAPDNYKAHLEEMRADPTASHGRAVGDIEKAGLFLKATSSLVGASAGIRQRFLERRTDYEVELVAIIGRTVSDVAEEEALDAVAAYAVGLDITLRGPEERSLRKSIDSYTVLGPYLTTADEIGVPDNIEISLWQDGALRQRSSTADMVSSVARLVSYSSRFYTLHPGDLLYTGTCAGVGPIRPGEVLVATATRVGTMQVSVHAGQG